jgi:hypothetical protein
MQLIRIKPTFKEYKISSQETVQIMSKKGIVVNSTKIA